MPQGRAYSAYPGRGLQLAHPSPGDRKHEIISKCRMDPLANQFDVLPEVLDALRSGKPVVALESTIISHGMPYPRNVETALQVEHIIREGGAVPATIAVLKGKPKVGLSPEEIDYLGSAAGVVKTSRRDLPFVIAQGLDGATTVAGTMILAAAAGIRVFVT